MSIKLSSLGPRRRPGERPVEYSLLLTATMCLLAFGVVMVFSASSTTSLLGDSGDGAFYLKRTLLFGVGGLLLMWLLAANGVAIVRRLTPLILALSIFLLAVVLVPGVGIEVNGARRWLGAGLFQVQPSELAKLALVLYGAHVLATRPKMVRRIGTLVPYLAVVALACGLVVIEPDLGTAMVACLTTAALLAAAGVRGRDLAILAGVMALVVMAAIALEPYRMERLTGFLDPSADPAGAGFQSTQARIALGSGGLFGVGLGESLQKAFYLPESHTDMIAAVIGEELGLAGIVILVALYGLFAYAGLRTAQRARDRYAKLLATGITSLVLAQATINLFAVLGLAPLTGVPLPFVSYGNSSMVVLLAGVGLLLNIASGRAASAASPARSSATRRTTAAARATQGSKSAGGSRRKPAASATGSRARKGAAAGGRLRVVDGGRSASARRATTQRKGSRSGGKGRDSGGGNRGTRGSGARRRRGASG